MVVTLALGEMSRITMSWVSLLVVAHGVLCVKCVLCVVFCVMCDV